MPYRRIIGLKRIEKQGDLRAIKIKTVTGNLFLANVNDLEGVYKELQQSIDIQQNNHSIESQEQKSSRKIYLLLNGMLVLGSLLLAILWILLVMNNSNTMVQDDLPLYLRIGILPLGLFFLGMREILQSRFAPQGNSRGPIPWALLVYAVLLAVFLVIGAPFFETVFQN
jgi:FtsH-binding integral membrane protein